MLHYFQIFKTAYYKRQKLQQSWHFKFKYCLFHNFIFFASQDIHFLNTCIQIKTPFCSLCAQNLNGVI
jgi:hypothetical protein